MIALTLILDYCCDQDMLIAAGSRTEFANFGRVSSEELPVIGFFRQDFHQEHTFTFPDRQIASKIQIV